MPSLLIKMRACLEPDAHSDAKTHDVSKKGSSERSRGRSYSLTSGAQSAACRGLYAASERRSVNKSRTESREKHHHREDKKTSEEVDDNDPVIKYSMYPQMIGKRRSELEPARKRSVKYDRATTRPQEVIQQQSARLRRYSVDSDLTYDSEYESDGNPEGRPIRVCMYPQAKYIKEPVNVTSKWVLRELFTASGDKKDGVSSSHTYKRSSLPFDEYQILVRRQKTTRAREVLEPHFAHHGLRRANASTIWHGFKQGFTIRNTERRRISKVKYAVRKALKAGLELTDTDYKLALHRHRGKVHFCELSDVDGIPIEQMIIDEFTRMFREAQNAVYVLKSTSRTSDCPHPVTWIDDRIRRQAAELRRMDSGVGMNLMAKRPQLVSKLSWDSSDGEVDQRKRLTKTQR